MKSSRDAADLTSAEMDALDIAAETYIAWLDSAASKEAVSDEDWATLGSDLRNAREKIKKVRLTALPRRPTETQRMAADCDHPSDEECYFCRDFQDGDDCTPGETIPDKDTRRPTETPRDAAESVRRLLRLYLMRRHEPGSAQWHRDCARECIRVLRELAQRPTETPRDQ